jgi:hypothetical protein
MVSNSTARMGDATRAHTTFTKCGRSPLRTMCASASSLLSDLGLPRATRRVPSQNLSGGHCLGRRRHDSDDHAPPRTVRAAHVVRRPRGGGRTERHCSRCHPVVLSRPAQKKTSGVLWWSHAYEVLRMAGRPDDEYVRSEYEELYRIVASAERGGPPPKLPRDVAFDLIAVPDESSDDDGPRRLRRVWVTVLRFPHPFQSTRALRFETEWTRQLSFKVDEAFASTSANDATKTWAVWNTAALIARYLREDGDFDVGPTLHHVRGHTMREVYSAVRALFPPEASHKFNGGEYGRLLEDLMHLQSLSTAVASSSSPRRRASSSASRRNPRASSVWRHLARDEGGPYSKSPSRSKQGARMARVG